MDTRYSFRLPRGYVDAEGKIHSEGTLRLATAQDEVAVLGDPRSQANRAYVVILLLARVIIELGDLRDEDITPDVVERLFSVDLAYLQRLYREINGTEPEPRVCPHCGKEIEE